MKNLFIRLTLFGTIVILLACIACGTAHAQKKRRYKDEPAFIDSSAYFRDGFKVKDFHAEIDVRQDGYFTVTERYDIEFISNYKHGILRTIPLRYIMGDTNGVERKVTITIDSVSVTGRNFKQEADGGNNLVLKIGDPDVYATGRQEYAINYRVKNAFTSGTANRIFTGILCLPAGIPCLSDQAFPYTCLLKYCCRQRIIMCTQAIMAIRRKMPV